MTQAEIYIETMGAQGRGKQWSEEARKTAFDRSLEDEREVFLERYFKQRAQCVCKTICAH